MPTYSICAMESIGPAYQEKLKKVRVRTAAKLLERARTPKGRRQLAQDTGICEALILRWANMADLMRVRGVAEEYSELLEAAGVDTVKELKRRNVANLTKRMQEVNAERCLVRLLPSEKRVEAWVRQAKSLPPMMTY
ncbi:DUF4332 domain-containing protein [Afifella sp. IM 167]|uniref:DUF4332 domain-containing protein n=1 Tax=Afifella sp. IM 167 TaxID=2033586 RepID=UPI001CCD975D|nr:DUF4332 domain-containing protein [Afifella sp. IM 167]MBZ8133140.1 ferredoxin [Afifella sp. IM 167]